MENQSLVRVMIVTRIFYLCSTNGKKQTQLISHKILRS